jgi:hypothetical protein
MRGNCLCQLVDIEYGQQRDTLDIPTLSTTIAKHGKHRG